jgi:hypothetical protein
MYIKKGKENGFLNTKELGELKLLKNELLYEVGNFNLKRQNIATNLKPQYYNIKRSRETIEDSEEEKPREILPILDLNTFFKGFEKPGPIQTNLLKKTNNFDSQDFSKKRKISIVDSSSNLEELSNMKIFLISLHLV